MSVLLDYGAAAFRRPSISYATALAWAGLHLPGTLIEMCGFNPRPRVGGDFNENGISIVSTEFQSTPPRGGDLRQSTTTVRRYGFNPRPRMRGDCSRPPGLPRRACFNPRPAWGAT
jgi:hypothetical protein